MDTLHESDLAEASGQDDSAFADWSKPAKRGQLAFWERLEQHGESVALVEGETTISYVQLARMADEFASRLPDERQLVALEAANSIDAVVCYLACLRHGHPIVLLSPASVEDGRILETFRPNALYRREEGSWNLKVRDDGQSHAFNDDLAVLLSTSGTTGSPKLVKLSKTNIESNAASICEYLEIDASDRAMTTLGFFYSYGMSVVNSHLAAGARLVLTEASVIAPEFWTCFHDNAATSLAFVPFHFDLLDQIDFIGMRLPTLRHVTQAGGRLEPDVVRKYGMLSLKRGWRFYVMYGQTEAAPRMSYVPPDELLGNPDTVGRPIPGGRLSLIDEQGREVTEPGVRGELVYCGANVMIGYAESPADLAKPKATSELRTGDIAVFTSTGHVRIVGRHGRFVKLYGLRISLDDVQRFAARQGGKVYCVGNDRCLAAFVEGPADVEAMAASIAQEYHLHRQNVFVRSVEAFPRLANDKIDLRRLEQMIEDPAPPQVDRTIRITEVFKTELSLKEVSNTESFVTLGGDSLAYLSLSLELEKRLGYLPRQWERMSIAALEALSPQSSRWSTVPVEVPMRVFAILTVIALHVTTWPVAGGPLALLFLSGYSIARSHGERLARGEAWRFLGLTLGRILLVFYGVLAFYFMLRPEKFSDDAVRWFGLWANFQTLDSALYPYWYICAYVHIIALLSLVWLIPSWRKFFGERRMMFGYIAFAVGVAAALAVRTLVHEDELLQHNTVYLLPVFALGWVAFHSETRNQKLIASTLALIVAALFWAPHMNGYVRTAYIFAAALVVIWHDQITLPKSMAATVSWLATISFYVYILHIIPVLVFTKIELFPAAILEPANLAATLVVSVAMAAVLTWVLNTATAKLRGRKSSPVDDASMSQAL